MRYINLRLLTYLLT